MKVNKIQKIFFLDADISASVYRHRSCQQFRQKALGIFFFEAVNRIQNWRF
jgi:hypothetical protein